MTYCIVCKDNMKSQEIMKKIENRINLEYNDINPDVVIAIGGDGTILKSVHKYPNAIIFGVHTGHLGFYTNYTVDNLEELIEDVNSKSYNIEYLDMLSGKVIDGDNNIKEIFALNEITVITPPRTLTLDVYIDEMYFEKFRGTGLCISTPTGSTGYNKSLAGSIVDPRIKAMQITEIAGINSNAYRTISSPVLLSSDRRISLCCDCDTELYVVYDNNSYKTDLFRKIEIYYNGMKAKLGYHTKNGYINRVKRSFLNEKE